MTTAYFDLAAASRGQPVLRKTSSDETLIQSIAAGDRLAMRTLFARHRVSVYRWLLRLVNDEALAEDLLSDVFLDVWRHAASFEARASVSTWLLAIARYKALSARRRRTDAALDDQIASTVADPADGPDLVLEKKSTTELMGGASPSCRLSSARSWTSFIITRSRLGRWRGSSEFPNPRSKHACSMPARNWRSWSQAALP